MMGKQRELENLFCSASYVPCGRVAVLETQQALWNSISYIFVGNPSSTFTCIINYVRIEIFFSVQCFAWTKAVALCPT
jgi:hypothetical protein